MDEPGAGRGRGPLPRRRDRTGTVRPLRRACSRRPWLADRSATTSRRGRARSPAGAQPVAVLVGPAGTGKTFTLDAVRAAFEHAGHAVVGAAPSARAAIELAAGAGIPARTLHSAARPVAPRATTPRGRVAAGGRRGRHGRHPHPRSGRHRASSPPAGGCCSSVTTTSSPRSAPAAGSPPPPTTPACVAELTVNRRQRQPWEQAALRRAARRVTSPDAVAAYLAHDRVVVTDSPAAMIAAAVDRWFAARDAGLSAGAAGRHQRPRRRGSTRPSSPASPTPASSTAPRWRSGRRRSGSASGSSCAATAPNTPSDGQTVDVANGQTGHVVAIADGRLTVRLDHGGDERGAHRPVPAPGRAPRPTPTPSPPTGPRAAPGTWPSPSAPTASTAKAPTSQLSRGAARELARAHRSRSRRTPPATPLRELDRHDTGLTPPDEQARRHRATTSSSASAAPTPSSSPTPSTPTSTASTTSPAPSPSPTSKPTTPPPPPPSGSPPRPTAIDGADLADQIARVDHIARHVALGGQVSPSDRHNVGTVTALDDTAGQVHRAVRLRRRPARPPAPSDWADLRLINAADPTHPARRRPGPPRQPSSATSPPGSSGGRPPCAASASNPATPPGTPVPSTAHHRPARHAPQRRPTRLAHRAARRPARRRRRRHHLGRRRPHHRLLASPRPTPRPTAPGLGPRPATRTRRHGTRCTPDSASPAPGWPPPTASTPPTPIIPSRDRAARTPRRARRAARPAPPPTGAPPSPSSAAASSASTTPPTSSPAALGRPARPAAIGSSATGPTSSSTRRSTAPSPPPPGDPTPACSPTCCTRPISDTLADAIANNERWLRSALCAVADRDDTILDANAIEALEQWAAHPERAWTPAVEPTGSDGLDVLDDQPTLEL